MLHRIEQIGFLFNKVENSWDDIGIFRAPLSENLSI